MTEIYNLVFRIEATLSDPQHPGPTTSDHYQPVGKWSERVGMVGIWSKKVGKGQKFEKSHRKLFFEFKLVLKASVACLQPMLHVANSAASLKKVLQL